MRLAGLFLAFLACLESTQAQGSVRAMELMREAEARLEMADYAAAASRFEQSYNWEPGFEAAFSAGYCHFKLKKFPEAELWLGRARQMDRESERAAVYLASAQIANHKPRQAVELLEEFVRGHGNAVEASATLAAIRSDSVPRAPAVRTASILQILLVALTALSLLLFFVSLRADNVGIREAGKGLALVALASFYLLSPFPLLIGLGGYAWAAYKLRRGYRLFRLADPVAELGGEPERPPRPTRAPRERASDADPLFPYFQILDVPPSASQSQVKSGYRRQVRRCHPDVISHLGTEFQAGAADRFRRVQQAYETVCRARGWQQ